MEIDAVESIKTANTKCRMGLYQAFWDKYLMADLS